MVLTNSCMVTMVSHQLKQALTTPSLIFPPPYKQIASHHAHPSICKATHTTYTTKRVLKTLAEAGSALAHTSTQTTEYVYTCQPVSLEDFNLHNSILTPKMSSTADQGS